MMNLELSIYEAERYGEIDEYTRDVLLEMVAMETVNLDKQNPKQQEYNDIKNKIRMLQVRRDSSSNEISKEGYNKKIHMLELKLNKLEGLMLRAGGALNRETSVKF